MKTTRTNAETVIDQWLAAVNAHELEAVLSLYAENSVLLPTFSPGIVNSTDGLHDYFSALASRPGLAVSLSDEAVIYQVAGDQEIASGIYFFHWEIEGERHSFESRFTFVIDSSADRPIIHHHSSEMPKVSN